MLEAYGFLHGSDGNSFASVFAEFDKTARRGWAHDNQEVMTGVCCFGAPVRFSDGRGSKVVASVSISVPCAQVGAKKRRAEQVVALGDKITRMLSNPQCEDYPAEISVNQGVPGQP